MTKKLTGVKAYRIALDMIDNAMDMKLLGYTNREIDEEVGRMSAKIRKKYGNKGLRMVLEAVEEHLATL